MSLLNGEWWIDESGNSTYADGDVSSVNHEIAAFEAAIGMESEADGVLVDIGGFSPNTIGISWFKLNDAFGDVYDPYDKFLKLNRDDQYDLLVDLGVNKKYLEASDLFGLKDVPMLQWFEDHGANMDFVLWCLEGQCDARDYALEKMFWIRVKGDNFQMWNFDDDALKRIKDFDEWQNVDEDIDLEESDDEIGIEEMSTGWYENVPLKVLFKSKSAAGLKRYMSGVGKFHRNPKRKRK